MFKLKFRNVFRDLHGHVFKLLIFEFKMVFHRQKYGFQKIVKIFQKRLVIQQNSTKFS